MERVKDMGKSRGLGLVHMCELCINSGLLSAIKWFVMIQLPSRKSSLILADRVGQLRGLVSYGHMSV